MKKVLFKFKDASPHPQKRFAHGKVTSRLCKSCWEASQNMPAKTALQDIANLSAKRPRKRLFKTAQLYRFQNTYFL